MPLADLLASARAPVAAVLRSGLMTPARCSADRRTISIPDADRIWYSAGVGYQIDRNLSVDRRPTLIDGKKVDVSETLQLNPA